MYCILVYSMPALGLIVTTLVFRLSIIRGTDGGWWVALGHGICIGWPSQEQIYHLCLFLRIVLHSGGLSMIEGTPEAKCVAAVGCVNFS